MANIPLPGHQLMLPTLPQPITPLVGREREVGAIADLLRQTEVRLITLIGPGGIGKTRLALAVAERLQDEVRDGAVFVALQSINDPELVASVIAQSLGVEEPGSQAILDNLRAALQSRHLLLVLDNFEHLLPSAPLVTELLASCPELTVLVTSRAVLHLYGERVYIVPPLDLPDLDRLPPLDQLAVVEAIRLFVERAQAGNPAFELTADNAPIVAAICARVDSLPLAIELAAARVRHLSPAALLARLEHRLQLLTGGPRDLPERQKTIRDTIAWSYDLLAPDAQRLLRQFAVFVGGWTLEAAEAICDPKIGVLDGLSALVDHSLVRKSERPDGSTRYDMLETIRDYGLAQLGETGEAFETALRHVAYVLEQVECAGRELHGPGQEVWLARLDDDHANVCAALGFALEHGDGVTALRIAVAVAPFWHARSRTHEGLRWLERAASAGSEAPAAVRAKAYTEMGELARKQSAFAEAERAVVQAVDLYRAADDRAGLASAINSLAWTAMYHGEFERAAELYAQALDTARTTGDRLLLAEALASHGVGLSLNHDYESARTHCEESLTLYREAGDRGAISRVLTYLGYLALWQGDVDAAALLGQESLSAAHGVEDYWLSFAQELLGHVALERSAWDEAGFLFRTSLRYSETLRDFFSIARAFDALAAVAGGLGNATRGATLLGAAAMIRERFGCVLPPPGRPRYERTLADLHVVLRDAAFAAAWDGGKRMSLDEAIQYALTTEQVETIAQAVAPTAGLSKREFDVLRGIVEGKTNQEIAAALFISPRTVETHVANILGKLSLDSRAAVAVYAVRQGLV
jgi:non-specific serine/threonine protein kinase